MSDVPCHVCGGKHWITVRLVHGTSNEPCEECMSFWEPTNQLRLFRPRVTLEMVNAEPGRSFSQKEWDAFVTPNPDAQHPTGILQQLWKNSDTGETEWRPVPEVREE